MNFAFSRLQTGRTTTRLRPAELGLLFIFGLAVASACAAFQSSPGYMDAQYYHAVGRELAAGKGWWEPFLWNYLDDPAGIPHPAFVYWMPLATLIAAGGMRLLGGLGFEQAQVPFLLQTAVVPVLAALIGMNLSGKRRIALLAGWLAVVPGIFLPLMTTTDNISPVMLAGGLWFLAAWSLRETLTSRAQVGLAAALGLLSGLLHLARADGLLWLGMSGLLILYHARKNHTTWKESFRTILLLGGAVLLPYLLVTWGWYARNLQLFGTLFSPASSRAIWIGSYNELYSYPANHLTFERWLSLPLQQHLGNIKNALAWNAGNLVGTQTSVFLLPLVILASWKRRGEEKVRWFLLAYALIAVVMTFFFPLSGSRGGYLHSIAALQAVIWVLAADGLERAIGWLEQRRGWNFYRAWRVFAAAAVIFQLGMSGYAVSQIVGQGPAESAWDEDQRVYRQVEDYLTASGAETGDMVLTNNPPGYYAAASRGGISIPDGPVETAVSAGARYGARYLLLEEDQANLDSLYVNPIDQPGIRYLGTTAGVHIFELTGELP